MKKLTVGLDSFHIRGGIALATLVAILSLSVGLTVQAQTASTIPLCEITRNLSIGATGEDVRCLQRYLNWAGFTVASTGAGSPGSETQFYGNLTSAAVIRWQNANSSSVLVPAGLSSGSGFWGPLSFAHYVQIVNTALGVR